MGLRFLSDSDLTLLMEMLPAYEGMNSTHRDVFLKLAASVHEIEASKVFWVVFYKKTRLKAIKAVREWKGMTFPEAKAIVDEGKYGPLDEESVDNLMEICTKAGAQTKVEVVT